MLRESLKILIAGNGSPDDAILELVLRAEFHSVTAVTLDAVFAEVRSREPPELILIDLSAASVKGYDICRSLKADDQARDIPVVFITKRSEAGGEELGLKLGAVDYMTFSTSPLVMRARIHNHILMRQKNRQLYELNELKNGFIGMVAHDLRNPLSAIQGYAEMCLDESIDSSRRNEFLHIISDGAGSLLRLVNDLLDYSAIENSQLVLDLQPGDLGALVVERSKMFIGETVGNNVQLVVSGESPQGICYDADRMRQVIDNLIGNAIKFSRSDGKVTVTTSASDDGGVEVSVCDQGEGIPAADLELIFSPFKQSKGRGRAKRKGVGLGLSIVKRIVDSHHGTISVESTQGVGSVFRLSLPAGLGKRVDDQ